MWQMLVYASGESRAMATFQFGSLQACLDARLKILNMAASLNIVYFPYNVDEGGWLYGDEGGGMRKTPVFKE